MLAEQWARENNFKFPSIDAEMQSKKFAMKEFELPGCGSLCAGKQQI